MKVIDFFDRGVQLSRDRACTIDQDTGIQRSYGQVWESSHRIARGLLAAGAKAGVTKVALLSHNCGIALECILGILRSGAVWAPVNARNSSSDVQYLLDANDVEILLYHSDFEESAQLYRSQCPKLRHLLCIDSAAGHGSIGPWLRAPLVPVPAFELPDDAPMAIFGSGGTTGKPKGVVHSHRTWECLTVNLLTSMPPRGSRPVHLVVAPMTHAAGSVALPLLAVGATQVLMKHFDAGQVLHAISHHRVTHMFLPPTAVYMLLAENGVRSHDYSSLEYFIYAAAPMSVEKVKEAMGVFGPVMVQTYGQAEAGPLIGTFLSSAAHAQALRERPERLASCGQPTLLTRLKIVDDDGREVARGQVGEIAIGGDFQMIGYYRNEAATREARRNGFVHTGDVGRMDEDGFVYIVDRKREMIITGGFNVYPSEIEQAIFAHPAVQDCAVVGVPDAKWGEAVKAVIQLRPQMQASPEEIIGLCKQRLGSVMAPKSVEFWEELPRSAVGKVMRRAVRQRFWEGRTRTLV